MNGPSERASAYARKLLAAVTQTTPAEREEVLEFRAKMYGPRSAFADPAWVRWLYDDAPAARAKGPALWIFRHEGRIEAHQGAVFARLRIREQERTLAWTLDLMVSPAQRMRGIGAVLPQVPLGAAELGAGTEVSEAAQKSFARAGWQHLGTLPLWVHLVDPAPFLRERVGPGAAAVLGPGGRALGRAVRVAGRVRALGRRLVPMAEFDERADAIWRRCAADWPVIVRRDLTWLRWRWDACPRRESAFGMWFMRGQDAIGWAMLRVGTHRGEPAGFIVDLLCEAKELPALLALSVNELAKHRVVAVYCLFRGPGTRAALQQNGFLERASGLTMMCRTIDLPPEEQDLLAVADNWYVTSGDSDLDRPREHTVYA
ncbi:MAG TPA: hypothetical protein VHE30_12470 [Polyangiaceae bacterium]|nr:hypothetical protein [Polyangiaceae bacterium]